jgi:hypothetical protein
MSASVHEQILARVHAVLLAAGTAAATRVERDRTDSPPAADTPAINITRGPGAFEPLADQADAHGAEFAVECWASGAAWSTDADALHMQAHAALVADATLAQLMRSLRCVATAPQFVAGEVPVGHIAATYRAQTLVRPRDLSRHLVSAL